MNVDDINNSNNGIPVRPCKRGLMLPADRKVFFIIIFFAQRFSIYLSHFGVFIEMYT